jgi:hypothetical protein
VVIADTRWKNPNVFYEIGLAHMLNKPVILLGPENEKAFPFDLTHFKRIEYNKDIFTNRRKTAFVKALKGELIRVFIYLKTTDENKIRPQIPYMSISRELPQDKLKEILKVINDLKETVPQLLGDRKVITEYIEGEEEAFKALTTAVGEAQKSVRTTRFSPYAVIERRSDFFEKINNIMKKSSLKEFYRIIATNVEDKRSEITRLIANNYGQNFYIYLSKHEFDFELVIIDEKIVFIHFGNNKNQRPKRNREIISATLKITNPSVAKEFVKIFDNMIKNTFFRISCKDITSRNRTQKLEGIGKKFNEGLLYFKNKERK